MERLKRDLIYKEFGKICNQASNLFKLTYVDPLEKDFYTKIVESIYSLQVNMIICQEYIGTKIVIFHQIYNVGGNILNSTKELLDLYSSRGNPNLLKFKQISTLGANKVEFPN